jgi:hypothetical protein
MEQGLPIDPLARPASTVSAAPIVSLSLHPDHRPLSRFAVRHEEWGLVLLHGNHLLSVRHEAAPLLEALTGQVSLSEIQAKFGQPGLSLVGKLYQHGLVSLLR